jgi:hypothetical protein
MEDLALLGTKIRVKKQIQRGVYNPTVVHTATHLELTTRFAKARIREVRGRGFRPQGSHPCGLRLPHLILKIVN